MGVVEGVTDRAGEEFSGGACTIENGRVRHSECVRLYF